MPCVMRNAVTVSNTAISSRNDQSFPDYYKIMTSYTTITICSIPILPKRRRSLGCDDVMQKEL